jgi:hypothetical protein
MVRKAQPKTKTERQAMRVARLSGRYAVAAAVAAAIIGAAATAALTSFFGLLANPPLLRTIPQ